VAQIGIGIIGFGKVGTGTAKNLVEKSKLFRERFGLDLRLRAVCDIDLDRRRPFRIDRKLMTSSVASVLSDPGIHIVVETVGGTTAARDVVLDAIAAGKLRANRIDAITGILNGTCNFVLSRMTGEGTDLQQAVRAAQKEGYAELDPSLDLDGVDAAHKIALLSTLAHGRWCDFTEVPTEGITRIVPADIAAAEKIGHRVKLITLSREYEDDTFDVRVGPMLVPASHHLGQVEGAFNAVEIHGDFVGEIRLFGMGAGMISTASAVAADVLEVARAISTGADEAPPHSWPDLSEKLPLADTANAEWCYFVRVPGAKRGRAKLLTDTLRNCYAAVKETFRVSAGGRDFTAAVTAEAREVNLKRALEQLRQSVEDPDGVYAIPLLPPHF
jgi:homoserine dehydrogenase